MQRVAGIDWGGLKGYRGLQVAEDYHSPNPSLCIDLGSFNDKMQPINTGWQHGMPTRNKMKAGGN